MADEMQLPDSTQPDPQLEDPYVNVEPEQPVWQNIGGDH